MTDTGARLSVRGRAPKRTPRRANGAEVAL